MAFSVNLCHRYPEPHNENKPYLYSRLFLRCSDRHLFEVDKPAFTPGLQNVTSLAGTHVPFH